MPFFPPVLDRRSDLVAIALASVTIVGTTGVGVMGTTGSWVGWLPATVCAWALAGMFGMATSAALGAWLGGGLRRARMMEWVTAQPHGLRRSMRRPLILGSLTSCGSALLVLVIMLIRGARHGLDFSTAAGQSLLATTLVLSALTASTALGIALGRAWPAFVAIPLGPVAVYLVYGWVFSSVEESSVQRLWVTDGSVWQTETQSLGLLIPRLAWWLFLSLAVVAVALGLKRTSVTAALIAATSAGVILGVPADQLHEPLAGALQQRCDSGGVRVCVPTPQQAALKPFAHAVRADFGELPSPYVPRAVIPSSAKPVAGDLMLDPSDGRYQPSAVPKRSMVTAGVGQSLFLAACDSSGKNHEVAGALMVWWLRSHHLDPFHPLAPGAWSPQSGTPEADAIETRARWFMGMTKPRRDAWLRHHVEQVRQCTVPMKDVQ